jgi:hypothetical protein
MVARSNNGTDNNYNKVTINKCAAAVAEDDDVWQEATDEQ